MHKDLSEQGRRVAEGIGKSLVVSLPSTESLGIAREAMINAFDAAAEKLDG